MASKEKDLEDRLREVGSRLASPPSAVDELLPLLDVSPSCPGSFLFPLALFPLNGNI